MKYIQKALWFVESHYRENMNLEDIARACGVSAFHLTRSFAAVTGISLMRYVRGRRLSEAARELARGSEDILSLALDVGYGSHEAFTRAFREQFELTPEQYRTRGRLDPDKFVEAIQMQETQSVEIKPTTIAERSELRLAGLVERQKMESPTGIPDQWQRFVPYIGNVAGQLDPTTAYGVSHNFNEDGDMDYLTGVAVDESAGLPKEFQLLRIPARRYAIFAHADHVAMIKETYAAIWGHWFPGSDYEAAEAPTIEVYGPNFDGRTGLGGVEIWIPLA